MAFNTDPVTSDPPDMGPSGKAAVADHHVDAVERHCRSFRAPPAQRSCRSRCRYPACRNARRTRPLAQNSTCAVQGKAHRYPACAGQSPAQDLAVAAHRADSRRALLPAEFLCADFVALLKCRDENGLFLSLSSFSASFSIAACSGSIFNSSASSFIADSSAYKPGTAPGPRIHMGAPKLRCTVALVTSRFGTL